MLRERIHTKLEITVGHFNYFLKQCGQLGINVVHTNQTKQCRSSAKKWTVCWLLNQGTQHTRGDSSSFRGLVLALPWCFTCDKALSPWSSSSKGGSVSRNTLVCLDLIYHLIEIVVFCVIQRGHISVTHAPQKIDSIEHCPFCLCQSRSCVYCQPLEQYNFGKVYFLKFVTRCQNWVTSTLGASTIVFGIYYTKYGIECHFLFGDTRCYIFSLLM